MSNLLTKLDQFHGSEKFYKLPLFPRCVYTEGIRFLAQEANCYWLLDFIFAHQNQPKLKDQHFQVWRLQVAEDQSAKLNVLDGNNNHIVTFSLRWTDFPLKDIKLWFVGETLLLPSEY